MKTFVVGGMVGEISGSENEARLGVLKTSMNALGRGIVEAGHDLVVCSPFPESADREAVIGAAGTCSGQDGPAIEFHYPDADNVRGELARLQSELSLARTRVYGHPLTPGEDGRPDWKHSWLLAQLSALDNCHAVVTVGGKLTGTASLLLHFADGQKKPILPFTFLGGAAAEAYERRRYELADKLGPRSAALHDPTRITEAPSLLADLTQGSSGRNGKVLQRHFFLSYARERPQEADFVEMLLRRRGYLVFRDDSEFGPGQSLPREVTEYIHRASVFVALWCREYACSPWCFDELELAVERSQAGNLTLWLLCVDSTRIVPKGARSLLNYPSRTREELEGCVLKLLARM